MHDASKILLGTTQSSYREGVTSYAADPAAFPAGTAVRLKNDGTLSVAKNDGEFIGISLGKSLSDNKRVAVLKSGLRVPILLTDQDPDNGDYDYVTIGAPVYVDDATGLSNDAGEDIDSTITNAVYVSGPMTGVAEDGSEVAVALIDMVGGL